MSDEKQGETEKKGPYRTVTEFSGTSVQKAAETRTRLQGEGVTEEQMSERLGEALGVSGDRLARLTEALQAVGDKAARVRLVRVFASDHEPRGATKIGEFNYVVDWQPEAGGGARG